MTIIKQIKKVRDGIKKAEKVKCTCSGFIIQYEGKCCCKRGKAVKKARTEFWEVINNL